MDKKLILFDIDGVLIKEGTFFGRWSSALKKVFNVDTDIKKITTSGKTDISILSELARTVSISQSEVKRHINELRNALIEYVKNHISETSICAQDGVENLLKELKNRGYFLGLVTGNIEANAKIKLEKVRLYQFFDLGSFGDTFTKRNEIIEEALKKAELKFRMKMDRNSVFYFGDSPLDIKAGKEVRIKTIAVATGGYSKEYLQKVNPDFVFQDLSNTKRVLDVIK